MPSLKVFGYWPWIAALFAAAVIAPLGFSRGERPMKDTAPAAAVRANPDAAVPAGDVDRSPVDLAVSADETWAVVANATSGTASLISLDPRADAETKVRDEIAVGELPSAVAFLPDGKHVLVSAARSACATLLEVADNQLKLVAKIDVGHEPRGIAVSADGRTAYVALTAEDKVAIVDLAERKKVADVKVGRWPRYVCLSPDGSRLAVGCSGGGGVWVVDTAARSVLFSKAFAGLNLGHMALTPDGKSVWFTWTFYGQRETSPGSIRLGWVMASRLGIVGFDEQTEPQGMSLDPRRDAVSDVHGVALSADGKRAIVAAGGTHELLSFAADTLPFMGIGGSEHMDTDLARDRERFRRIPVGGRPLAVRLSRDSNRAIVANYLRNSIQVVDLVERKVSQEIALGGATEPATAVRRGEAMFHDAGRSLENWYTCHTCHFDGGPNAETIDTFNDGSAGTYKTVPALYNIADTGPWTWHGWQKDLHDSISGSFVTTMRGEKPTEEETADVAAYLQTLRPMPNPHRPIDGKLGDAAERGKAVFASSKAGCANCHGGPHSTDGEIHDVGLGRKNDRYEGYNTPSLVDVQRRIRLLHDGRARTLEKLLTGPHNPAKVTGEGELSEEERADLIEYLKTL
jgi:DNA-binding beta-propeller fold protein YncE/cytochrome c2